MCSELTSFRVESNESFNAVSKNKKIFIESSDSEWTTSGKSEPLYDFVIYDFNHSSIDRNVDIIWKVIFTFKILLMRTSFDDSRFRSIEFPNKELFGISQQLIPSQDSSILCSILYT